METQVKMIYKKEDGELEISCSGRNFDVSIIKDLTIEQWAFPFISNGVKWKGLYEELKAFVGSDSFSLQFEGDNASFEVLKYLFKDVPVQVFKRLESAKVTIIYSENPFVTKIVINGAAFDTAKIQNRSIDEWISPIDTRGVQWKGIFSELENFLHSKTYTIYFIGEQRDMSLLVESCPDTVNVFYRDLEALKIMKNSKSGEKDAGTIDPKGVTDTICGAFQKTKEVVNAGVSTATAKTSESVENSAIKGQESELTTFMKNHFVGICAVLLVVLLIFPFMRYDGELTEEAVALGYTWESVPTRISGFGFIFGYGNSLVKYSSSFAIGLIVAPIWMFVITYLKMLKPYAKYLIYLAPVIGILFGALAFRDMSKQLTIMEMSIDEWFYSGLAEPKVGLGIGFILTIAVYVISVVGAIRTQRK